jgi:hypothetical protein
MVALDEAACAAGEAARMTAAMAASRARGRAASAWQVADTRHRATWPRGVIGRSVVGAVMVRSSRRWNKESVSA